MDTYASETTNYHINDGKLIHYGDLYSFNACPHFSSDEVVVIHVRTVITCLWCVSLRWR